MLDFSPNQIVFGMQGWEKHAHLFQRMEIPARHVLLREGEVSRQAYYIEKGCLRLWFHNEDKEVTFQFLLEGQTVSSIESFYTNVPSVVTIESLEPSTIWAIERQDLLRVMEETISLPEQRATFINAVFGRTFHYMRQFRSYLKYSPAERYAELMKERPEIIQRIPQHYIASYLGITTVHLSRIKNKLFRPHTAEKK